MCLSKLKHESFFYSCRSRSDPLKLARGDHVRGVKILGSEGWVAPEDFFYRVRWSGARRSSDLFDFRYVFEILPVPASSMFIWHDVVCHSGASVCFAGKYCSNNGERIWVWGVLTRGVRTNKKRLGGPDLKREAHDPDF